MSNGPSSIDGKNRKNAGDNALPLHALDTGPDTSLNFSVAKVISIFTVVAGHWFTGTILWIPVTFGLFVFAFSSAYFTSKGYGREIDKQRFWRKKLERLGLRFWVILTFLAIILAAAGKPVFHWHSLVHYAGLSGVLNWLAIPNQSALGAGLWFFTLLLLFYVTYPYLAQLSTSPSSAAAVAAISALAALFLDATVKVGHELWLTAFGFLLGVVYGLHEPKITQRSALFLSVLFCCVLLLLNLVGGYKQFNSILILGASVSISIWVSKARLPAWSLTRKLANLDAYLLEIFLIHTYLFVHVTGRSVPDFLASLLLTVIVAVGLNLCVGWLSSILFAPRRTGV